MMNCKQVESKLSAYLDQELSRGELAAVRAHLHECPECARAMAQFSFMKEMLAVQPEPDIPEGLEDRLVQSVFAKSQLSTPRRLTLAWAGSAAFALAFAGAWMWLQAADARDVDLQNQMAKSDFNLARDQAYAAGGDPFAGNTVILTSTHGAR